MYKMVVMDHCPKCEASKKALKESNLLESIELVSITTNEGRDLAKQFDLRTAGSHVLNPEPNSMYTVEEFIAMKK